MNLHSDYFSYGKPRSDHLNKLGVGLGGLVNNKDVLLCDDNILSWKMDEYESKDISIMVGVTYRPNDGVDHENTENSSKS